MSKYLGDFTEDSTHYFVWDSNAGDGASITRSTDGTITVWKNGDATVASVAGVTDDEDEGANVGVHRCSLVLTDVFYATGNDYTVVLLGAVIDGETVNAVIAEFSIENRFDEVTLANGAHGGAAAVLTLKSAAVSNADGNAVTLTSTGSGGHGLAATGEGAGCGVLCTGGGTSGTGLKALGGASNGEGMECFGDGTGEGLHAKGGDDNAAGLRATGGTSNGIGMLVEGDGSGEGLKATGGDSTSAGMQVVGGGTNGPGFDAQGQGTGPGMSATGGADGHGLYCFGGVTSGDGIYAAGQTAGDGMTLVAAGANQYGLNGQVSPTSLDLVLKTSTFALAIADAIWDELLTGATHNVPSSSGRRLRQLEALTLLSEGTAQSGTNNTIELQVGENGNNDWYNNAMIVLTGGTGAGQARHIHDYNGGTITATVYPVWVTNPAADTTYSIFSWAMTHAMEVEAGGITNATFAADVGSTVYATNIIALAVRKALDDYDPPTKAEMDLRTLLAAEYFVVGDYTAPDNAGIGNIETIVSHGTYGNAAIVTRGNLAWTTAVGFNVVVPPSVAQFNARTRLDADYFSWASDAVARVTLVDTTTANTDMVGTTGAALAASWTAARAAYLDELAAANLPADVDAIKVITDALTAASATLLALSAGTIVSAAAAAGTLSTTQMTTNLTEVTNDHYNGRIIIWTSGVLKNQATDITDYVGATKLLEYTAVTEAPTAGDTFIIV